MLKMVHTCCFQIFSKNKSFKAAKSGFQLNLMVPDIKLLYSFMLNPISPNVPLDLRTEPMWTVVRTVTCSPLKREV